MSTRTSWDNAQLACERLGGGLAIIDTLGEAEDFATIRRLTGTLQIFYFLLVLCLSYVEASVNHSKIKSVFYMCKTYIIEKVNLVYMRKAALYFY